MRFASVEQYQWIEVGVAAATPYRGWVDGQADTLGLVAAIRSKWFRVDVSHKVPLAARGTDSPAVCPYQPVFADGDRHGQRLSQGWGQNGLAVGVVNNSRWPGRGGAFNLKAVSRII